MGIRAAAGESGPGFSFHFSNIAGFGVEFGLSSAVFVHFAASIRFNGKYKVMKSV